MSAVRAWHISNGVSWHGGLRLSYTLKGTDRMTPLSSKKPLRPPLDLDSLELLAKGLDLEEGTDVAVYATACIAFWGQVRLGELGIPNKNGSRTLLLPNIKCGGVSGESIIICRQRSVTDPITALDRHLKINKGKERDFLCSYLRSNGERVGLTHRKFMKRCNEIWLLLMGVPPDVVKVLGRWSSDAFLRYWRSVERLGPLYVELLNSQQHEPRG